MEQGTLLFGSENKAWSHFAPGPLSARYYTVPELHTMRVDAGFSQVEFLGSFEAQAYTCVQRVRAGLRRMITATGVFQRWPQAREVLKPLVYRGASLLSYDLCHDTARLPPIVPLDPKSPNARFKVFYTLAKKRDA